MSVLSFNHTVVDCGPLPDPANGGVDLTGGTKFGDRVKYFCNAGYIRSGTATRECLPTGSWSGEEPTCDCKTFIVWAVTCQEPLFHIIWEGFCVTIRKIFPLQEKFYTILAMSDYCVKIHTSYS